MRIRYFLLPIAAVALLAACDANPTRSSASSALSPEEAIAQRALQRWQHIIDKDLEAAYQMLTPGTRAVMDFQSYALRMTQAQIRWTGVDSIDVKCEDAELCVAEVMLDIEVHAPGVGLIPTQTPMYESWLLEDGSWYYLPRQIQ